MYHCAGPDVTIVRHTNQAEPDGSVIFRTVWDRVAAILKMGGRFSRDRASADVARG